MISRVSGGEAVGGEKSELMLRVKAASMEAAADAVMMAVTREVREDPLQVAVVGCPEGKVQVRADVMGMRLDVDISCDHCRLTGNWMVR